MGNLPLGDLGEGNAAAHDADEQIGNQQRDHDDEEQQTQAVGVPAAAEVLNLREEVVALAERPDAGADKEEDGGDDQSRTRRHQGKDADPGVIGFAGGSQDGERGHVGAKQRHQQQEGADGAAGDEVVLASAAKEAVGEDADAEY